MRTLLARLDRSIRRWPVAALLALAVLATGASRAALPLAVHADAVDAAWACGCLSVLALLGGPGAARREHLRRSGIDVIDTMSGIEFEQRLAVLFRQLGYQVRSTAVTGDFGADLVVEGPRGVAVVQAKRYSARVGEDAIQQVVASKAHYGATHAIAVTNSSFTRHARMLATSNQVELWDRDHLVDLLAAQMAVIPPVAGLRLLTAQLQTGIRATSRVLARIAAIGLALVAATVRMLVPSGTRRRWR
jgi:HJR/Mrr/RecB family endonuclease